MHPHFTRVFFLDVVITALKMLGTQKSASYLLFSHLTIPLFCELRHNIIRSHLITFYVLKVLTKVTPFLSFITMTFFIFKLTA